MDRTKFPLRLPVDDYNALKAYAHFCNRSMNEVIAQAVHEFLAGEARQEQMEAMVTKAQSDYRDTFDKLKTR